ncbi:MAG: WD40 repeat domain-containing protein, partial [Planctomycetota bacterium]
TLEVEREVKHAHPLYAVAFSPDGRTISFGGQEKKVYAVAVKGGDPVILSEKQPFDITALGYNHTGDVLAIGDESCDVWLLDVEAKAHLFHGKHHVECWLSSLAWAPDNETFLFGCRPTALAEASAASSAEPAAGPEGETVVAIEGIQTAIQAARTRHSEAHALTDEERKELAEIEKSIEAEKQALLEALGAKDLARDLDESVSRRAEACRENCERIQGSFTINQWKVKKK